MDLRYWHLFQQRLLTLLLRTPLVQPALPAMLLAVPLVAQQAAARGLAGGLAGELQSALQSDVASLQHSALRLEFRKSLAIADVSNSSPAIAAYKCVGSSAAFEALVEMVVRLSCTDALGQSRNNSVCARALGASHPNVIR